MATAVMRDLGLIDAAQSPAADDSLFIRERYQDLMEELRDDSICYWPDNSIPVVVFERVVKLVAMSVGGAFGLPFPTGTDLNRELDAARTRIRRHTAHKVSGMPVTVDDF